MTETNRIEYKRELTLELDIEKEVVRSLTIRRVDGEDCFKFTDNFIRIILPISVQDGTQLAPSRHSVSTQC